MFKQTGGTGPPVDLNDYWADDPERVRGFDLTAAKFALGLLLSLASLIMGQSVVVSTAKAKLERNDDTKRNIKKCFIYYPRRIDSSQDIEAISVPNDKGLK